MATLVHEVFREMCERYPDNLFVGTPPNPERAYAPEGVERTYADAARRIVAIAEIYREAGLGHGHRVAMQIENHPDFYLHRMALHQLGTTLVPLNLDHAIPELQHVFAVTKPELVVALTRHHGKLGETGGPPLVAFESFADGLPGVTRPAPEKGAIGPGTETTILFTSGTTGKSKGCIFDHAYELEACEWYRNLGGLHRFVDGQERLYSPLPLHHSNTGVHAFLEMLGIGGALITNDRFRSQTYWKEVRASKATIIHYLGVIMAMLYQRPVTDDERAHTVKFSIGAGVDPTLHAAFEKRFGFPLIELWGMTEIIRFLTDNQEPRKVGTRAFGPSRKGHEARIVDGDDRPVAQGASGELVVRYSESTPRRGFFGGYLGEPEATEHAWRGGWFHTGDSAYVDEDGIFHFVDRLKHIIRRAGQNIAAAEIEAALVVHPQIAELAALGAPDDIREEEVFLVVVPVDGATRGPELANSIFEYAMANISYYKAPGYILFVDSIPRTASQKTMKHAIFPAGFDPRTAPGVIDLRERKKRPKEPRS